MNGYFPLYVVHYSTFPTGLYSFLPPKLISLNVRGIRSLEKRKAVFNWLYKSQADICFLQETYSTPDVVNIWKKQWKGDTFFSHGSCHSKGTMILVKEHLDFNQISSKVDPLGRYIFLEVSIQVSILPYHRKVTQHSLFLNTCLHLASCLVQFLDNTEREN